MKRLRYWLISKLLTEDEKYLVSRAIDDRVHNIERIAITEKWADKHNIEQDVTDYRKIQKVFSNNLG